MKKYTVFLMVLALLLACGCNKKPVDTPVQDEPPVQEQPQTPVQPAPVPQPEVPQTPLVPETPEPPAVPEMPQTPEVPAEPEVEEPANAVVQVRLSEAFENSSGVDGVVPLEGGITALRSVGSDSKPELLIYDLENNAVLSRQELPEHDGTHELILTGTDPYVLQYYDGRDFWRITLDESWQQTREEYDPALHLSVMGDLMISNYDGSISIGRVVPPALQANDRMAYQFVRTLNDHQILYYAADRSVSTLSHYGVYDSETGETRAVTTMGQTVVGTWGDILLVARNDNGWWYDFGWVALPDYTYTPLKIGRETVENGINADHYGADFLQCAPEHRVLLLVGDKDNVRTAEVVDVESGQELYHWESPTEEEFRFSLAADGSLVVYKGKNEDTRLWKVEY